MNIFIKACHLIFRGVVSNQQQQRQCKELCSKPSWFFISLGLLSLISHTRWYCGFCPEFLSLFNTPCSLFWRKETASFVIKCTRGNQLHHFSFLHFRESKVLQEFKKWFRNTDSILAKPGALTIEAACHFLLCPASACGLHSNTVGAWPLLQYSLLRHQPGLSFLTWGSRGIPREWEHLISCKRWGNSALNYILHFWLWICFCICGIYSGLKACKTPCLPDLIAHSLLITYCYTVCYTE